MTTKTGILSYLNSLCNLRFTGLSGSEDMLVYVRRGAFHPSSLQSLPIKDIFDNSTEFQALSLSVNDLYYLYTVLGPHYFDALFSSRLVTLSKNIMDVNIESEPGFRPVMYFDATPELLAFVPSAGRVLSDYFTGTFSFSYDPSLSEVGLLVDYTSVLANFRFFGAETHVRIIHVCQAVCNVVWNEFTLAYEFATPSHLSQVVINSSAWLPRYDATPGFLSLINELSVDSDLNANLSYIQYVIVEYSTLQGYSYKTNNHFSLNLLNTYVS